MKTPSHVLKRGTKRWYHRKIPLDLIPAYGGRKVFKYSLHTDSIKEAIELARLRSVELDGEFARKRRELAAAQSPAIKFAATELTDEQIRRLCLLWQRSVLETDDQNRLGGFVETDYDALREHLDDVEPALRQALARGQFDLIAPALHNFLFLSRVSVDEKSPAYRQLQYQFLQSVIQTVEAQKRRLNGEVVRTEAMAPVSEVFQPKLAPPGDGNADNYIGMRYTWLKMSEPSIEALRQAFLDHESRVRLQPGRPSDDERHPRLVSISVKGAAFLEDQTIHFSPNLNCVIGGRGSGKSSLLEYLRFCLQPEYLSSVDKDLYEKLTAIHRTVEKGDAELRVTYEVSPGVEDTVMLKPGSNQHRLVGREVHDLHTVLNQLRVQFFSQGELSRLSKPGQKSQVLRLIDASCGVRLEELSGQETDARGQLEQLFTASHQAETVGIEVQRAKQELDELTRQWQARKDIQVDAQAHRSAQDAKRFAAGAVQQAKTDAEQLRETLQAFDQLAVRPEGATDWPHADWFQKLEESLKIARTTLQADVEAAVAKYVTAVKLTFEGDAVWPTINAELNEAESRFIEACEAKGLQPADVTKLQDVDRQRVAKQTEVDGKVKQLLQHQQRSADLTKVLGDLHEVWRQQFEARKAACAAIQGEGATTLVSAEYMLDSRSFQSIWERLSPRDNRTRLGKGWDDIGTGLFGAFAQSPGVESPWELLQQWMPAKTADDLSFNASFAFPAPAAAQRTGPPHHP